MHRDIHLHRLAASASDREGIARALDEFAATDAALGITVGKYRPDASAPAFIYSGNGSQWVGMGLMLLDEDAQFREAVEEVDALYARISGESILAELKARADQSRFALTEVAQPALFAVQVASPACSSTGGFARLPSAATASVKWRRPGRAAR